MMTGAQLSWQSMCETNKVIKHRLQSVPWLGVVNFSNPRGCRRGFAAFIDLPEHPTFGNGLWLYRRYLTEYQCRMGVRDLNKFFAGKMKFSGASLI